MRDNMLAWFFDGADGDLGLRAMSLEPTTHSEGEAPQGISVHQYEAADRYRRIEAILREVEPWHRRTLERHYAPLPPSVRRLYAGLGDVLAVCLGLTGNHAALASTLVSSRSDKGARLRVEGLIAEAEELVKDAHQAYRAVRDRHARDRKQERWESLSGFFECILRAS